MKFLNSLKRILSFTQLLFIGIFFGSCDNNERSNDSSKIKENSVKEMKKLDSNSSSLDLQDLQITPEKLVSDSAVYLFNADGVQLFFDRGEVVFCFNPQCAYRYPMKKRNQKIIFYWDDCMNCTFDRGLKVKYPDCKNPNVGDEFGAIEWIGDQLVIDYYFPEWVNKVNRSNQDVVKLFPKTFKLVRLVN
jgi:hypothetical protein